jgi:hypothetical protein
MFHPHDTYSSNNQGIQQTTSLSFVPTQAKTYNQYSLEIDTASAVRLEQLFVEQDETGNITAASYDSGAQVRLLDSYTMVRAVNSSLWMGDRFGNWHPID